MSAEWLEAELAVHEDDGIIVGKEIFRGGGTSSPYRDRESEGRGSGCLQSRFAPALKLSRKRTLGTRTRHWPNRHERPTLTH